MVNQFSITINNKSGSFQNYNLFSEPPKVTGSVVGKIWTNIYQIAQDTPYEAEARFDMWKQYYACVGTWKGGQKAGAKVSITQTKPVDLGIQKSDGTVTAGTTLNMSVINERTPAFDRENAISHAYAHSFEVDSNHDFTLADAKIGNFFIGLASSPDGGATLPVATFMPEPGSEYQIQPVNTYYVTFGGNFAVGELLDVSRLSRQPLKIDFTQVGPDVVINHTENGELVISKA